MPKPEVMIIGIDGATFDLIGPWAERGYLPNIAELMRDGCTGVLRSTLTPNTCPAWKSLSTGMNPGRLGVFDWRNKIYGSYDVDLVDPGTIKGRDLWNLLGATGRKVAVVGVPMTYPPRPVNGVMLTGMLTPTGADFAYPAELAREIEDHVGEYRLDPAVVSMPTEDELFEDQNKITISRFEVLRYLLERERSGGDGYDFVMVVFTAADRLQHLFWPPAGTLDHVVLKAYQQIDWAIAQIRLLAGPDTTVVLMSDHGFSRLRRLIHVNQLFADMGLLAANNHGGRLLQRLRITRQSIGRLARALGLEQIRAQVPDAARQMLPVGRFGLDMARTTAYSWSAGEVFINLRGREPHGIVEPGDEYEALRSRIIDALENLTDANRRLNIRVFRREEVFTGEHVREAPDLMVDVAEPGYGLANRCTGVETSDILPGVVFSDNPGRGGRHDAGGSSWRQARPSGRAACSRRPK
ncbi:MAG: alkaline phosphatase family protein [Planctomycetes bacterium]|nr:alkaline phosphatase family protein [Planctomycetota bacterium]